MAATANVSSHAIAEISFWKQQLDIAKASHADLVKRSEECVSKEDFMRDRITLVFLGMKAQSAYLLDVLRGELGFSLKKYKSQTVDLTALYPFIFSGPAELTEFEKQYDCACARISKVFSMQDSLFQLLRKSPYFSV